MYTLVDIKTSSKYNTNADLKVNSKSIDDASLKLMAKLFEGNKCKKVVAILSIISPNKRTYKKTVVRKMLSNPIDEFLFIHYIEN